MKFRLFGLFALCCAMAMSLCSNRIQSGHSQTTKSTPALSKAEQDLLNEINQARAQPQTYATYLEQLKPLFKGKNYTAVGQETLTTQEGWDAVEDAIKFLRAAKPLGPLTTSRGLCLAASSHVKEQSASGATGHAGANNTMIEQRVKPFGSWQGGIGENLTYGNESARERILTWLIDDGVTTRGHRKRIMSQDYRVAGLSCGPHPEYGTMCVLALAGGFTDSKMAQAPANNKSNKTLGNSPPSAKVSASAPTNSANKNATKTTDGAGTVNGGKKINSPR
ncbi:MAG TPA: CAP domain-containing protein [Pyrinomonadaceae bacterium]|nr:CAP domain-containing protein [Pyrinomonadaceae bacterium]